MKLKIVLADLDESYIEHFLYAMKVFYLNEIEVVAFSQQEALENYLESRVYDILLVSENFPAINLPKIGAVACFVDNADVKEMNGKKAICKYQRIDQIHREVLYLLSEEKKGVTYSAKTDKETCFIGFTSAAGGVGKTTVALTYARKMVQKGYQVLYITADDFPVQNNYLNASGDYSISNVLFAVKCRKGNLQLKIESALRLSYGGLYFFEQSQNPMEITELEEDDWREFFKAIRDMGKFHCVVFDMPVIVGTFSQQVNSLLDKIVVVSDSRNNSIVKTQRMMEWLMQTDKKKNTGIKNKIVTVQNCSMENTGEYGFSTIACLPLLSDRKTTEELVEQLTKEKATNDLYHIYTPGGEEHV